MKRSIEYLITDKDENITVEHYLRSKDYTSQSITELKKYKDNCVINGEWVHVNRKLIPGDTLIVTIHEDAASEKILPVNLPFPVIYEDEDIIVVNKPSNMPIHPSLNNYDNSLGNAAAYYYQSKGEKLVFRCINRLDRDTTGLTIIAKHYLAAGILHKHMRSRDIHREYLAIVDGIIENDTGRIIAPIGRVDGSSIERCIDYENGESAITNYKVIAHYYDKSLIALRLETGRTHQIRVHMKHIGHPLLGDFLYNPNDKRMNRQALHSYKLEFLHPITRNTLSFTAPLPEDMANCLSQ